MKERRLVLSVTVHDCRVETFNVSGAGGQRRDHKATGVRITHPPSGGVGKATEQRSQAQNKRQAWLRLVYCAKFQAWMRVETARRMGQPTPEQVVEEQLAPRNLKVEARDDAGKWAELEPE